MTLEQIRCIDIFANPHHGGGEPQEIEALYPAENFGNDDNMEMDDDIPF